MNIKRNGFRFGGLALALLGGGLSSLPVAAQLFSTNSLIPVADAHVQNGNNAGINFGSASTLLVQTNGVAKNNYDSYLKFSLGTVSNLTSARLRFRARVSAAGTLGATLYSTATNWSEPTLTWNNKPLRGTALGSVTISGTGYGWYELDVTSSVLQEKAAGRIFIAWCLHNTTISNPNIEIQSREASGANRPVLVCTSSNLPPMVTLTQPLNNAVFVVPTNLTLAANASDGDGSITQVSFFRSTILLGSDSSAPYTYTWTNVSTGSHTLTARARDNGGLERTSAPVTITVKAPAIPPTVTLSSPAPGTILTYPASLTLSANAADADGTIAQVRFYDGPTLLNTDTAPPYTYLWTNALAGSHSLTAVAVDQTGLAATSGVVLVTINLRPVVNLVAPGNGAAFPLFAAVTLTAEATDSDGTIAQVRFLVDGSAVGTDTGPPFTAPWTATPGAHVLTAEATDNRGAATVSAPITIDVLSLDGDPGLTGFWKFEEGEGAIARDSSGNGREGALSAPAWVEGKVGSHALGLGAAMTMTVPNPWNGLLPGTGRPFSLSMWIKPTDLSFGQTAQTVLLGNPSGPSGWRFGVLGGPGEWQFRFWSTGNGGSLNLTTPAPLLLNTWSQLALTYNGEVATIYLDGARLGSGTGSIVGNEVPLQLGQVEGDEAGLPVHLDDLKCYQRELAPVEFGLTGHWKFEEGAGGSANDTSGHDNGAVLVAPLWASGRQGSHAVRFNGGYGSLGNLNHHALPETGRPFSVSLWFSPDELPTGLRLLLGAGQAEVSGWRLGILTPGLGTNEFWFWSTNNGGNLFVSGRRGLVLGQWYELTLTYSGSEASIYLDGERLGRASGLLVADSLPLQFGGGMGGMAGLATRVDDLKIYQRELSVAEISLAGYWRFDEQEGRSAGDSSGHGHHALVASSQWSAGYASRGSLGGPTPPVSIANSNCALFPPTGQPFSLSAWLYPRSLPTGYSGLAASGTFSPEGTNGWQLAFYRDPGGANALRFWSTDNGGTLDLRADATSLAVSTWTRLDVTFNGGIATVYLNGRLVRSDSGGIIASTGAFQIGGLAGIPAFDGAIDELKVFSRALDEFEVVPLAKVAWETVWMNTTTNILLPGSVPPGRLATYTLVADATNGVVSVSAAGTATYTPNPGYKGPDAFTYAVTDGDFLTTPAVVALSVVKVRYLSPSGGSESPREGTSPENAWVASPFTALDDIYRTNQYYDCFYYLPGTYETMGWKYEERKTANPGCKHMGSGREGPNATVLKLVNLWHSSAEENIFASYWYLPPPDGFEVRDMVLDCNAAQNPKYAIGEPITLTIPLPGLQSVDRIRLFWKSAMVPNGSSNYTTGPAQDYVIEARDPVSGLDQPIHTANIAPEGDEEIVLTPPVETGQIQIRLTRRAAGVSFYSLREIEIVAGGSNVALAMPITAKNPYGAASALSWGILYSAARLVDGDEATEWISGSQGMCAAIAVGGNNLKFINLKVMGFGTKASRECFPFYIAVGNAFLPAQEFGNVLVDNCLIADPAIDNTDGCSALVMVEMLPSTLTNQVVRGSQVASLKPYFDYSHGFTASRVEHCLANDVHIGVYFEPDAASRASGYILIQSNVFLEVQSGITFNFHPDIHAGSLTVVGNEFGLSDDGTWALVAYEIGASSLSNVTVLNNVVRFNGRSRQAGNAKAFHSSNIQNALFGNNMVAEGAFDDLRIGYGFDPPPPGARRAWLNNRAPSGSLLPVAYFNGVAVVPATQSQWP